MKGTGRLVVVFSCYLAVAVLATWPLAFKAADHVVGDEAGWGMCVGTPNLNLWAMGFVLHQLPRDPLRLFDGNAFYPYSRSLAFSEHLFVPALLAAPFLALTGNLVLAYNVVSLLSLTLAGFGMFLLARELVGDGPGALAAGLLYAFHSFNINELLRIQILSNQWFPFLTLALLRFFSGPCPSRAAAVGLIYALQSLSCMYWLLYAPFLVAPVLVTLQWRSRLVVRHLVPLAAALGAALVLSAAFASPYLENQRAFGFARGSFLPTPIDRYAHVLPGNWLYSGMLPIAGPNAHASHFIGFFSMALAALGAWRTRAAHGSLRLLRPALLFLVLFGLTASLGDQIPLFGFSLPGPYAFLRAGVPGFDSSRYPERFSILAMVGIAPLVAAGVSTLPLRRTVMTGAAALVFLEHLSIPLGLAYLRGRNEIPEVHRWLARQADVEVVAEIPTPHPLADRPDGIPMYLSTFHWKRTLQGYTGYVPPACPLFKWLLFSFPSHPEANAELLAEAGVDVIVVWPKALTGRRWPDDEGWTAVGPFPEGHVALRLKRARSHSIRRTATPFQPVSRRLWRVSASEPGAEAATDGDPGTAWTSEKTRGAGLHFRVAFKTPIRVKRIRISLTNGHWTFPTSFEVWGSSGRAGESSWPLTARRFFATCCVRCWNRHAQAPS